MMRPEVIRGAVVMLLLGTGLLAAQGVPRRVQPPRPAQQPAPRPASSSPSFEAVAETRLLMDGLAHANYQGLVQILKKKPGDADTWAFARGQALLIAETGNLLLLRPPNNQGRDAWMQLGVDLRHSATSLARAAGSQDYEGSQAALKNLATTCNKCHQTFRIGVKVGPEMGPPPGGRQQEGD
jgi:hypothetical protein